MVHPQPDLSLSLAAMPDSSPPRSPIRTRSSRRRRQSSPPKRITIRITYRDETIFTIEAPATPRTGAELEDLADRVIRRASGDSDDKE